MVRSSGLTADRAAAGKSASWFRRFGRGVNGMISALTKNPPIMRSLSGQPRRARSDTLSFRAPSFEVVFPGLISNARHDRFRGSFQARTLSLEGRPRAGAFARAGKIEKGSDGGARQGALRQALHGDWCAPRPPSDSGIGIRKSPRPVSRRGRFNSCDDDNMPVICPTCQIFSKALVATQGAHALKRA